MGEREYLDKGEALKRLSESEGSQENIWAEHYDDAMAILSMRLR
jgi:hypothetical protein